MNNHAMSAKPKPTARQVVNSRLRRLTKIAEERGTKTIKQTTMLWAFIKAAEGGK